MNRIYWFCTTFLWTLLLTAIFGAISRIERLKLKEDVREMFRHAYNSYKNNAYPEDELMPLSCKGRSRFMEPYRGDIDDALGNFSLTLIDSLDSLFLLNELDEFESAVKSVIRDVVFDSDLDVSVFETNIRVLGGLLGAHVSALEVKKSDRLRMQWYNNELLKMAKDIGTRLLPAFNTSTGIPLPRINLRHGGNGLKKQEYHTCTACAGTMILEFAVLSRLTGDPIFEEKAARALAYLWSQRSRYSDLIGRVINVQNGHWVGRESGIGAGFDSYYEYLFKAYMLLGEPVYFHRFHTHYEAIKQYVSGPQTSSFPFLFLDVNMHRPLEKSRSFMDSLFAFWPGVQVLTGDVKPAIALHEFLFQVHKRNKLLPEAFTPDLSVHWSEHLLRPEFIESTYLLYQATGDPYYLDVGARIVSDLQTYARVPCGFASIKNVKTMEHMDRFDSYVLAETFKYLYLLFAEPSDLPLDLDKYIFTTEAHLLPIGLSRIPYATSANTLFSNFQDTIYDHHGDRDHVAEAALHHQGKCAAVCFEKDSSVSVSHSCEGPELYLFQQLLSQMRMTQKPSFNQSCMLTHKQLLLHNFDEIRQPLRQLADKETTNADNKKDVLSLLHSLSTPLTKGGLQLNNPTHITLLKRLGIRIKSVRNSEVTLEFDENMADSPTVASTGYIFFKELVNHSGGKPEDKEALPQVKPRHVIVLHPPIFGRLRFAACPANFDSIKSSAQQPSASTHAGGSDPSTGEIKTVTNPQSVIGTVRVVVPIDGCSPVSSSASAYPSIYLNWKFEGGESEVDLTSDSVDASNAKASKGPLAGSIGIVRRGGCFFTDKAQNLINAGAIGVIVVDNDNSSSANTPGMLFTMSGQNGDAPTEFTSIPVVFMFGKERDQLLTEMRQHWDTFQQPTTVLISESFNASETLRMFFATFPDPIMPRSQQIQNSSHYHNDVRGSFILNGALRLSPSTGLLKGAVYLSVGDGNFFRLTHLPDPIASSETRFETSKDPSDQLVGSQWVFTVNVPTSEANHYYAVNSELGVTERWMKILEYVIGQTSLDSNCKRLLLSVLESTLQILSETTLVEEFSPLSNHLTNKWNSMINQCLIEMENSIKLRPAQPPDSINPPSPMYEVSLHIFFKPILSNISSFTFDSFNATNELRTQPESL